MCCFRNYEWIPRSIKLRTFRDVDALLGALDKARVKLGIDAKSILASPGFAIGKAEIEVNLVVISVADLGFGDEGASLAAIHTRARALGLELCPPVIGPLLRLLYMSQPLNEWLHIGMAPIAINQRDLADFTIANGGAGLLLLGGDAQPDLIMPSQVKFVFVRPTPGSTVAR